MIYFLKKKKKIRHTPKTHTPLLTVIRKAVNIIKKHVNLSTITSRKKEKTQIKEMDGTPFVISRDSDMETISLN